MLHKIAVNDTKGTLVLLLAVIVIVAAGIGTGWYLSGGKGLGGSSPTQTVPGTTTTAKEAGVTDESKFPDQAEGTLEKGGADGEGTHHLVRDNNPAHNVYLTSTVIDLETFTGKKVHVWGQTVSAKEAGWLMDVGKIRVLD